MHDVQRIALGPGLIVGEVQAGRGRRQDRHGVLQRQLARLVLLSRGASGGVHDLAQVGAVDVLHREERRVALVADVVDLGDVRVGERRHQARLVEEHAPQLRIEGVLRQDPLDDDQLLEPFEPAGLREIDLRHSTDSEATDQLIFAEALALGKKLRELLHRPLSYSLRSSFGTVPTKPRTLLRNR